ncbi:uncharacterized protein GV1 [Epargyreus clarus]|uniref:uncharacterized protein GV1 n=1 Tax=Epargyreus clarus TaxID=520877 RepID=UPI003C2AD00B
MKMSMRLQVLTCLLVYVSSAHGIMVKFGTKSGPVLPPTPEPLPPPQPYRVPAPVWEERANDAPDPNAHWRPQFFIPQPRYTQVAYNVSPPPAQPLNNAQRFANSYRPQHQPIKARPVENYISPTQFLSSQNLPGFGIRYFVPAYVNELNSRKEIRKQEDAKHNDIETNNIDGSSGDSSADLQWKYEKDSNRRIHRDAQEGTARHVYQWPVYVHPRH